jgi:PhzF family phenazine biosynthesis protein
MNLPYYQIDAFTDRLFSGNPAGVCPLAGWLPDEMLQSIAAENNLAETAFFVPGEEGFDLRWFTPEVEMDLCGHATLATAHVLFRHLGHAGESIRFQTRSGLLAVTSSGDLLTLDFPPRPAIHCETPADLITGLGQHPVTTAKARDYLAVFETEDEIRNLQPKTATSSRASSRPAPAFPRIP